MKETVFDALFFGQNDAVAQARNNNNNNNIQHSSTTTYYYGPATGINWCERDYDKTKYVAEFWNTLTNLVYIYVGINAILICKKRKLPLRFYLISYFFLFTGVTSALFHATLHITNQRLDEIFENASMISIYHTLSSLSIYTTTTSIDLYILSHVFCCCIGILFVTYFLFCEIHLIGISIISGRLMYNIVLNQNHNGKGNEKLLYRINRILFLTIAGGICWLLDRVACEQLNHVQFGYIQLHAWCKFANTIKEYSLCVNINPSLQSSLTFFFYAPHI
jgi:hypothetical protein